VWILSPSEESAIWSTSCGSSRRHRAYDWILNPEEQVLVVHRLEANGYLVALTAGAGEAVRAEPFDSVELDVSTLLGGEDDE
jgi:hypothetical protein